MRSNLRVQEAIMHGESEGKTFYEIIDAGVAMGMQTFDKSILQGYADGLISEQIAMAYASQRSIVRRGIDQIKNARGEKTTDLEGLALDDEYAKQFIKETGRR
jgi:twitching motility protein PilT